MHCPVGIDAERVARDMFVVSLFLDMMMLIPDGILIVALVPG